VRNVAFLALATLIGVVVYVVLNVVLNMLAGDDSSLLLLTTGAAVAIAGLVSGAQLGGRIRSPSPGLWGVALGSILALLLTAPLLFIGRGFSVSPVSALPIGLVFVSAFLGVRATARSSPPGPGTAR
jgi:hypothetical protein